MSRYLYFRADDINCYKWEEAVIHNYFTWVMMVYHDQSRSPSIGDWYIYLNLIIYLLYLFKYSKYYFYLLVNTILYYIYLKLMVKERKLHYNICVPSTETTREIKSTKLISINFIIVIVQATTTIMNRPRIFVSIYIYVNLKYILFYVKKKMARENC